MKLSEKLIASFTSLLLSWLGAAHAQDAKLIEAAKKEGGKVVVYGSLKTTRWICCRRPSRKRPGWKSTSGAMRPTK